MENEEKTKVFNLCKDYLDNAWTEVALRDIECERLLTGYGNKTYRCSIKDCVNVPKYNDTKYKEVVVRVYGSELCDNKDALKFNGEAGEAIILCILSKMGIAPKLLGVFSGGVIVEYIPSRVSTPDDWKDMELCAAFVRKLAREHTADVPISKRPNFIEKGLHSASQMKSESKDGKSYTEQEIKEREIVMSFPADEEYDVLTRTIPQIRSKVVFCHCDLNNNNLLLRNEYNSIDERIVFVDYECCTYFYRGFDIAEFLFMNRVSMARVDNDISVTIDCCETNAKEVVIDEYLKEKARLKPDEIDQELDTVEHLTMEVEFFDLLYRATMAVFGQLTILQSKKDFATSFAINAIQDYGSRKEAFIRKYSSLIKLN